MYDYITRCWYRLLRFISSDIWDLGDYLMESEEKRRLIAESLKKVQDIEDEV